MSEILKDENHCIACDEYLIENEKEFCSCGAGPFCYECLYQHEELCLDSDIDENYEDDDWDESEDEDWDEFEDDDDGEWVS
jgi:hypothetical protein